MTRKDFCLIAEAIAEVEADYKGGFEDVLQDVTEALSRRLKGTNPRFDSGRFEAAAMPLRSERKRAAVVAQVAPKTYPDSITFEADGKTFEAEVGLPLTESPSTNAMLREYDGDTYQVFIVLGGGFAARPVPVKQS
jgi:hypothetical protein